MSRRYLRHARQLRNPRTLLVVLTVLAGVSAGAYLVWRARWHVSRKAIEMADGSVRSWAKGEVLRLSHGAYLLTTSTIKVDEAKRSISVDTITLTTDSAKAVNADKPLPILHLQFRNCGLQGIDLTRLAAGRGLHVVQAGCDTVTVVADVTGMKLQGDSTAKPDSSGFLALQRNLKLPRQIPSVSIDKVAFPTVSLDLEMRTSSGQHAAIALDRLAGVLDSFEYDPHQSVRDRRTLLSRNAVLTLDHFSGSREAASRLDVDHLSLDLAHRTIVLDGFNFEPLPGHRTDSLGFATMDVRHLRVDGVDWRALLSSGDMLVGHVRIDTAAVGVIAQHKSDEKGIAYPPLTLETSLRAIDRNVRLDSLAAHALSVTTKDGGVKTTTSVGELLLAHVDFGPGAQQWANAFPVGRMVMAASNVVRESGTDRLQLKRVGFDVPAQTMRADGFRAGPTGTDADFVARSQFQHDRVTFLVDSVRALGVDFRRYIRRGEYTIRRADVAGFSADVLVDHNLPNNPAKRRPHRTPQGLIKTFQVAVRIDTMAVDGKVSLRERDNGAPAPGVLLFDPIHLMVFNANNDPARMTDSTPLRVVIDSRLMRAAPIHLEATVPLLANDFRMRWHAEVGAMPTPPLNAFLENAAGLKFLDGHISQIRIAATVSGGRAVGTVVPRWEGLRVELPGVARNDHGLLGGIKRGLAKFAANNFAVRKDNPDASGKPALNGVIDHRWSPTEALPAFLWLSIREALLPLLKH